MPQKLYKDTAFYREGKNKPKKKRPFPQKKTKTTQKHHFRKLHVSTPPLIPLQSPPQFRFRHHPPSTTPESTSSTSASRHRRHRLTDVDDVDLEGVEQRGKRMCRYRTYINALSQLFGSLLDNMVVLFVHFSSSHVSILSCSLLTRSLI